MTETSPTDDNTITFDSRDQAALLAQELIDLASQEICIFGPIIDHVLYDDASLVNKLSEFVRRSPRRRIRILVNDTRKNVVDSHRILPLAQKLTSSIEIHINHQKYQDMHQQFLLVDSRAYLFCPNAERYQGRASKDSPAAVRDMKLQFEEYWSHSRPDPNSRRLHL